MSVSELKAEFDRLSLEEQDEFRFFLRSKIRPLDAKTRRELTEAINDKNPTRWLTLEEVKKRLGDE